MAKSLNVSSAIALLKKVGYNVVTVDGLHFVESRTLPDTSKRSFGYNDRELIKFARSYKGAGMHFKAMVKEFDRKGRSKERQAIQAGKAEDLPLNEPLYREDVWKWD